MDVRYFSWDSVTLPSGRKPAPERCILETPGTTAKQSTATVGVSILTLAVDSYTPALSRLDSAGVYVSSPRIARAGYDLMRL